MLSVLLATAALATPGAFDRLPVWSPDGTKIAFIRSMGRNSYLEVARSDGGGLRRLSRKAFEWFPSWSPDGRSIAFTRVQHGRDVTIWTVRTDGSRLRKIASGLEPAWSAKVGTIAYGQLGRIESVRPDGSHRRVLVPYGGLAAWSPDGAGLAYSIGGEEPHVYVLDVATGESRLVANGFWPTWSPSGNEIGYTRGLYPGVVAVDRVSDAPVSFAASASSSPPRWSPDGTRYVFCWSSPRGRSVAEGPPPLPVTFLGRGCDPQWSPSGGTIAFDDPGTQRNGSSIFLMDPDGANVRSLIP